MLWQYHAAAQALFTVGSLFWGSAFLEPEKPWQWLSAAVFHQGIPWHLSCLSLITDRHLLPLKMLIRLLRLVGHTFQKRQIWRICSKFCKCFQVFSGWINSSFQEQQYCIWTFPGMIWDKQIFSSECLALNQMGDKMFLDWYKQMLWA